MNERKLSIKIFPKLLLTLLLISAIPLAGLWYLSTFKAQETLKANLDTSLSRATATVAADVNGWIEMNLRALQQNAALADMASMDPERQLPILNAIDAAYEWTYLVFTTDANGNNIARSDGKPLTFYGDRRYFQQVREGAAVGQQVLMGRTSNKPALCLAVPIKKQVQGTFADVLTACSQLDAVSKAIADTKIGATGKAFLVDESGHLIAHGDQASVAVSLQDFSEHPALTANVEGENVIFTENGKDIVAYRQQLNLGWTLVVQQDHDDAFAPLHEARRDSLIVMSLTIVLVLLAGYLFSRSLTLPIRRLTEVADAFSRGKEAEQIPGTERGDEVGDLARAIKRMGMSIQMAFAQLKKSRSQAA